MRYRYNAFSPSELERLFPFRQNNRRPDGFWDAEDATSDNIKGTSVDPHEPVWPRWKTTPPLHSEGDFVSRDPFFDIDEITQRADFYPPGRPLVDRNVGGHPASRQRVNDSEAGNLWRRRLLVQPEDPLAGAAGSQAQGTEAKLVLAGQALTTGPAVGPAPAFGGFIPGRALPGNAPNAVEPLSPQLRERNRKQAIIAGEGGSFSVAPNPNANPNAPWYEHMARSSVRDYAKQIEQVANEEGVDPDLIRAVMFLEETHGHYRGAGPLSDGLGISRSILPMNVNVDYWGDNFSSRSELNNPLNNIRAGTRMLKNIIGNFQSPASIATIGTLYNDSNATRISDYGARLDAIYKTRPWERELEFMDDQLIRQP